MTELGKAGVFCVRCRRTESNISQNPTDCYYYYITQFKVYLSHCKIVQKTGKFHGHLVTYLRPFQTKSIINRVRKVVDLSFNAVDPIKILIVY